MIGERQRDVTFEVLMGKKERKREREKEKS